jgi:hypothetical protein
MVIVTEAGGYFTGGKASFDRGTDDLGKIMMSRRYCCIRAVPATDVSSGPHITLDGSADCTFVRRARARNRFRSGSSRTSTTVS